MIRAEPHRRRRRALMDRHADGLILVRGQPTSGLNASFFYLSGVVEPRASLLLAPAGVRIGTGRKHPGPDYVRGRMVREVLFLPAADPLAERWGEESSATLATVRAEDAGVDAVLGLDELEAVLAPALQSARVLYYVRAAPPSLSGKDDADTLFVAELRRRFFGLRIEDATPSVHELRRIKDAEEIQAIEKAAAATGEAVDQVMSLLRPGLHEYELEAEITRLYRLRRGVHAFEPIVACGPNALQLHYTSNSGRIEPGQLLLLDTGASVGGYVADVTRTLPVDGRFNERQRRVYEAVLAAQQAAIELCRPGALLGDIHARTFEWIEQAGLGQFFVHGTSHHIGLEVHDVGDVHRPLSAGAVITVEPGVYLPEEGLGVRIEDDVLVTDGVPRVLTGAIPRSVEEIERAMAERR